MCRVVRFSCHWVAPLLIWSETRVCFHWHGSQLCLTSISTPPQEKLTQSCFCFPPSCFFSVFFFYTSRFWNKRHICLAGPPKTLPPHEANPHSLTHSHRHGRSLVAQNQLWSNSANHAGPLIQLGSESMRGGPLAICPLRLLLSP